MANNFEAIAVTDETRKESKYKVAVAESVGDVSFVLHCLHGPEVGFRYCLRNDNHIKHGNNRIHRANI
jgi:hypothetical protein